MQAQMTASSSPGASLAVTVNGYLVFARGYGYADTTTGEFVQPDSLFRIASNSKPITAAGIYKLIEQGKISLTTQPFATILNNLTPPPGTTFNTALNSITIQDLLQHTAGFDDTIVPDPANDPTIVIAAATTFGANPPPTPQQLIQYMLSQPLQHTPGTTYAYSNFGYIVLGYIIEQVSGMPYAAYIQQNVFTPAGIERTQPGADLLSGRLPDEVAYYDYPGAPLVQSVETSVVPTPVPYPYGGYSCTLELANGCWVSSTMDLLRFADDINGQLTTSIPTAILSQAVPPFTTPQVYLAVPPTGANWDYIFYGSLEGTNSLVHLLTNSTVTGKVSYSALFNTREAPPNIEQPETNADNAILAFVQTVKSWPSGDLFSTYSGSASSCSFTFSQPTQNVAAGGSTETVSVTDANYCAWSAVSNATWLHVTSGALNSDSGAVGYTVDANPGSARTGTIAIAGQTLTVTQNAGTTTPTTLTVIASVSTANVGQSVTLTATLSPFGAGSTNGETVTFSSGSTALGTATLTGGVAKLTTSSLPAGTDSITASYPGDANFEASTGASLPVVVSQASTTLVLTASPTPATPGQSVTLKATLTPFSGGSNTTNGELVTFSNGGTPLGTGALAGGVATFITTLLPTGTDSITASYSGDANFVAAASAAVPVVVTPGKAVTALALTATPPTGTYNQAITLTAKLTPFSSGSNTTNGETVTFSNGSASLGTGTLAAGVAALTTSSLPVGTNAITATYAGDANFTSSNSGINLVVGKATATITFGSLTATYNGSAHAATATTTPAGLTVGFTYNGSATAPTAAGSYTVVATISDPNYAGTATGTLVIAKATATVTLGSLTATYNGSTHAATAATVPAGLSVSFTYNGSANAPSAVGSYTVVATVTDPNYTGTATGTLVITGTLVASSTTLTTSAFPVPVGTNVTFTAAVQGGTTTPTGTVTFLNGTASLGTGTLNAKGVATLTTSFSTVGTKSITAQYGGDATFSGSTSTALTETVVAAGISASVSPDPLTIKSGSSGTLTITLTPVGGYTGTVTFSCGTLPANASCTFAPASVAITASTTTATETLTVNTKTSSTSANSIAAMRSTPPSSGTGNGIFFAMTLGLPGPLFVLFGLKRRKQYPGLHRLLMLTLFCTVILGIGALSGCGGSSGGSTTTVTPGSYTAPVVLNLSGGPLQTVNATIIVQ
jgi:CubicO group peptidase (beta-lactamase class C family)